MEILVNGTSRELADKISVADLLQTLGLKPEFVAVEVNLEIVPRNRHQQHQLTEGDSLEIVTLVGGG